MDSREALRHIVDKSGKSQRLISKELGHNDRYIATTLSGGRAPGTDVLATIAQACGYTLQLVGHGETLTLDGTKRDAEGKHED